MKTNFSVDLTDGQRQRLATFLAGKPVKRLATRDDVKAFVLGTMAGFMEDLAEGHRSPEGTAVRVVYRDTSRAMTDTERATAERLRAEGKDDRYIVAYITTGRRIAAQRSKA